MPEITDRAIIFVGVALLVTFGVGCGDEGDALHRRQLALPAHTLRLGHDSFLVRRGHEDEARLLCADDQEHDYYERITVTRQGDLLVRCDATNILNGPGGGG